ncbi:hypothetical protein ACIHFE_29670 [Streptomyces sp. NPDC052396]|uniref:hypothetical protein n=1 Tax=Streptomyces sp. NPDC052396 TaxID=3365689 RepID=UPI0037CD6548
MIASQWSMSARQARYQFTGRVRRPRIPVSASQRRLKPGDSLSGKAKKAQALLETGQDIEALDEDEFLRRLGG